MFLRRSYGVDENVVPLFDDIERIVAEETDRLQGSGLEDLNAAVTKKP